MDVMIIHTICHEYMKVIHYTAPLNTPDLDTASEREIWLDDLIRIMTG
jgi:hypothetical protein